MENAILDGKVINVFKLLENRDYSKIKKNILMLREASKNHRLRCTDCGNVVHFRFSEDITEHFYHSKGSNKDCPYSEYSKGLTANQRKAKKVLFKQLEKIFPESISSTYTEKVIKNVGRADFYFEFNSGEKLAIDYVRKINSINFNKKNQAYKDAGINNVWFLNTKDFYNKIYTNQEEMELNKRIVLNESINKVISFLDVDTKVITLLKDFQFNYKGHKIEDIFEINYNINDFILSSSGRFEVDFFDKYHVWKEHNKKEFIEGIKIQEELEREREKRKKEYEEILNKQNEEKLELISEIMARRDIVNKKDNKSSIIKKEKKYQKNTHRKISHNEANIILRKIGTKHITKDEAESLYFYIVENINCLHDLDINLNELKIKASSSLGKINNTSIRKWLVEIKYIK
ncbi:competence protein CoiA family protein [Maledivibacter halophilus]|uniref:Competence protein CoiA nuclease-like domain-containing protein n=1 Tax=Maledivibacter halophilus TaxID=36842 RepID=A0A1T5KRG9_9FIRM|nr:hypothetical protein [Maledivibacter halophilus]SKC66362.1 hypothetical protein SAMN02194393_02101 [Maledivibacter halophilus]